MIDVFGSVKGIAKLKKVSIDNFIFKLHYKATVMMLIVFSLIVTTKQYIGDPIDCIVDEIPQPIMDTYCWIYSTFTFTNQLTGRVGQDLAHPGVSSHSDENEIKYHKYYQWVCFVLIFQAILFYLPHFFWKSWESKRIDALVMKLDDPVIDDEARKNRIAAIVNYFSYNKTNNDLFYMKLVLCEVMNLVNVLGQIFFVDFFLDGDFLSYGHAVTQYNANPAADNENPMNKVFPKVTKCTFHKYGPSGTVQKFDGLCVLPVNILNEKIYAIIWFWFVILAILSALILVYRLITICFSVTRALAISFWNRHVDKDDASTLVRRTNLGDWFLITLLKDNIEPFAFGELVKGLINSNL